MRFDPMVALSIPPALTAMLVVYAALRTSSGVKRLPHPETTQRELPKVTIVVPACNEAKTLEGATRSKLETDYPHLEVLIVEDRSTDDTPAIADRLAAEDPRVTVVHVRSLPDGWLGKLHALDRGMKAATGEWVLLSDADVHLSPSIVRRAVLTAQAGPYDFVAAIPSLLPAPFFLDVAFATFMRQLLSAGRTWKVSDPRSSAAVGSGVFNLVRRSAYEKSPGFEWLRMEAADDIGLGQIMKRSGARCLVFNGTNDVELTYFSSLKEMMVACEKNGFAVFGRFRVGEFLFGTAFVLYIEVSPLPMLFLGSPAAQLVASFTLLSIALSQVLVARYLSRSIASALVPILGPVMLLFMMVRATILTLVRGGITWRGTSYPLDALRRGSRIKFF